jgi:hypothetical protein
VHLEWNTYEWLQNLHRASILKL